MTQATSKTKTNLRKKLAPKHKHYILRNKQKQSASWRPKQEREPYGTKSEPENQSGGVWDYCCCRKHGPNNIAMFKEIGGKKRLLNSADKVVRAELGLGIGSNCKCAGRSWSGSYLPARFIDKYNITVVLLHRGLLFKLGVVRLIWFQMPAG